MKKNASLKLKLTLKQIERNHRLSLSLLFAGVVFFFFVITIGITTGVIVLLLHLGVFTSGDMPRAGRVVLFTSLGSIFLGTLIAFIVGRVPLRPINKLINALNRLANGKYKTRLSFNGPLGKHPTFVELSQSFNQLAQELQNTEMLRSDFINNFSHEFKTPIVSIAGFAGLLKHGNLTKAQKEEYITIIEEESKRLSAMATNMLNLTRIENQKILTDATSFNVSEQIRRCILLLEDKWNNKEINLSLNLEEHFLYGNEELLKQVWINLFDNAIKFTPSGGLVSIEIVKEAPYINITVSNTGSEIPAQIQERIFRKFYQADESHATQGNGIGLTVAKEIVDLHRGRISVASENGVTTFTVALPLEKSTETPA